MSFEIESNIPLPAGYMKRSRKDYPYADLKVGDSFVVSLDGRSSWSFIFTAIHEAQRTLNIKLSSRLIEDGRRRVWRVS